MRGLVLFAMAMMLAEVYATHYRGGTFYWEKLGKSKIRVHWRLSFQLIYYYPEYYCTETGQHLIAENLLALTCLDCASNKTILTPLTLECTSISQEMGWSLLDGYVDYQADRKAFTMGFMTTGPCSDSSWIQLQNHGSGKCWSLLTTVDTSKPNDSPKVTAGLPVYRVRHGCRRLIDLNPIDPNNDPVKCRWANKAECPEARDSTDNDPVCGQATDLTKLYEKECKIEFITGEDDLEGWYGASVMIEDFPDTKFKKAKSTVPFQFLLDVTSPGSCVGPGIDLEECSFIAPGETWDSFVSASIQEGSDASTITEIQGSYPLGTKMSYVKGFEPSKKIVKSKLSFTPKEEGTYIFSFTATDNNGVQNDPKSARLIVSSEGIDLKENVSPPNIMSDLSTPSTNSLYEGTDELWTIKFDSPVTRPTKKAFIKIQDMANMEVVAKFNALDSNVVTFPESDPTIVRYPAPTGLEGGKSYLVNIDEGFGVKVFTTPCGKSAMAASDTGIYNFQIPKPPEPEVECGDSYITVRIPKAYVGNVPASDLHLHDTRCRIKESDDIYYQIQFGYDECGTIIKSSKKTKTKFYNTIRDDPKPIFPGAPVTRAKHKVEMQIICEMTGLGVSDVFFKPSASVNPEKYKSSGEFKTYLTMYEDSGYNNAVSGTEAVDLKQTLYFAAQSTSSKDVAIESCKAMAKYGTCTESDKKYTFIENGCGVDSSVKFSSSGLDHRFEINSFGFLQYGLTNEVFVKCKMVSCKPNTNSRCSEIKSGNCSRRRRASSFEEETDTFMTFRML
ncbi:uncharacterized protein LOC117116589 [Anneissia japonica]|uniref:uncharacterized protein LOC117116589 n=1 Tax=Anneissia japonica TaxID=1529436 RepID=UPI00142595A5|nr:uncharacterized protein LOC117116589 [Anneissia japonica]